MAKIHHCVVEKGMERKYSFLLHTCHSHFSLQNFTSKPKLKQNCSHVVLHGNMSGMFSAMTRKQNGTKAESLKQNYHHT
jgi:hypothetical protein